jgi:hypothetical protein
LKISNLVEIIEDALHRNDRPERHHHPARTLRLLPDHPVTHGDQLVLQAHLEATRAEAGQHRVDIDEPGSLVGGGLHGDVEALRLRHLGSDRLDQIQPILSPIDQNDVRAVERSAMGQE